MSYIIQAIKELINGKEGYTVIDSQSGAVLYNDTVFFHAHPFRWIHDKDNLLCNVEIKVNIRDGRSFDWQKVMLFIEPARNEKLRQIKKLQNFLNCGKVTFYNLPIDSYAICTPLAVQKIEKIPKVIGEKYDIDFPELKLHLCIQRQKDSFTYKFNSDSENISNWRFVNLRSNLITNDVYTICTPDQHVKETSDYELEMKYQLSLSAAGEQEMFIVILPPKIHKILENE